MAQLKSTLITGTLDVTGAISQKGIALSNTYLGKTDTATNSAKLNNQDPSYYLAWANITGKPTNLVTTNDNGKIPESYLPSYVDDVLEYSSMSAFPGAAEAETGKIYIDTSTNLTYRWGGSQYVPISSSLALGETSSTAYAGDKGKANATNIAALQTTINNALPLNAGTNVKITPENGGITISAEGSVKTVNGNSPDSSGNVTISSVDSSNVSYTEQCYNTDTGDTTDGVWTVTIPGITELTEGLTIKIRLKRAGASTCTLNLNGLGAKIVYFRYGAKLTTHYSKESVIALSYTSDATSSGTDRTGWIVENIYDSTNTQQLRKYYSRYTTKSVLYRHMFCFVNKDNLLIPANNVSNSIATNKTLTTDSFDLSKGIYYYGSTTTVAAGGIIGNGVLYQQSAVLDLRYSFNTGTTLTPYKPVYVVVTPTGSSGEVVLASNPISQTIPTTNDGNRYVFLGYSTDNYRIELTIDHPVYVYNSLKGCYTSEEYYQESKIDNLENNKVSKSGDTISGNLSPATNKGASLGTSSSYWNNIYGTTIYENGTSLADKYQLKLPTTTTAGKVLKSTSTAGTVEWADDLNSDTKNTAGSTNNTNKLFLIGALSQSTNPQTYSNSKVYMTDGTLTTSSIMTDDIKSSSSSLSLGATSSGGSTCEVASFYADSDEGTSATLNGHLAVFGDDDSGSPYKPTDKTGFGDLDTSYFNTGIALHDADNGTTYKLSFPAKSGTFATLDDTKIEIVDLTVVA